jgi:uncharacterized phosphosugar-binding protein
MQDCWAQRGWHFWKWGVMSAEKYYERTAEVLGKIHFSQAERIQQASEAIATTIAAGRRCYLFGSGHSVIPGARHLFRATAVTPVSFPSTTRG